jgi:hypothetical protein
LAVLGCFLPDFWLRMRIQARQRDVLHACLTFWIPDGMHEAGRVRCRRPRRERSAAARCTRRCCACLEVSRAAA